LDFAYIDGNHSLKSVTADLGAWWPKVKSGGIICGHDYYDRNTDYHNCGVKTAVDEFALSNGLPIKVTDCTSWWINKP